MFTRATGSKSKTLIASFGLLIRSSVLSGAQMIGSGSLEGAVGPSAAKAERPPQAYNGLPARNCRNRRRLADGSIGDDMADSSRVMRRPGRPFADARRPGRRDDAILYWRT